MRHEKLLDTCRRDARLASMPRCEIFRLHCHRNVWTAIALVWGGGGRLYCGLSLTLGASHLGSTACMEAEAVVAGRCQLPIVVRSSRAIVCDIPRPDVRRKAASHLDCSIEK